MLLSLPDPLNLVTVPDIFQVGDDIGGFIEPPVLVSFLIVSWGADVQAGYLGLTTMEDKPIISVAVDKYVIFPDFHPHQPQCDTDFYAEKTAR
ncbi:MAG: hypothetical protein WD601_03770 [Pseudohongiellaceae bacterium]